MYLQSDNNTRRKFKPSRPGKPIDGEKVIRIVKEVLEQRARKRQLEQQTNSLDG
jgi:hypothetical protein